MKELRQMTLVALVAVLALVAFPAIGHALLGAPTGNTCDQATNAGNCPLGTTSEPTGVCVNWDDLTGATKYSVDFRCTMTVDSVTTTIEFDIGTGDRTDDGAIGDDDLFVTFAELDAAAGTDLTGFECFAKVKGLNPGQGAGRQNHPFSAEDSCGVIL